MWVIGRLMPTTASMSIAYVQVRGAAEPKDDEVPVCGEVQGKPSTHGAESLRPIVQVWAVGPRSVELAGQSSSSCLR